MSLKIEGRVGALTLTLALGGCWSASHAPRTQDTCGASMPEIATVPTKADNVSASRAAGPSSSRILNATDARDPSPPPLHAISADTDPAQTRDGIVQAPTEAPTWCTTAFGASVHCRVLAYGPLYLTHVFGTGVDCQGQSIAVLRHNKLRLHVEDTSVLRGTRIALGTGDMLVLVQNRAPTPSVEAKAAPPESSPTVEPPSGASRHRCGLYWSGFAPYGTKPSLPVDVEVLLDF